MFIVFWLIVFFMKGSTTLTLGTSEFIALIIAVVADFFYGWRTRWWVQR